MPPAEGSREQRGAPPDGVAPRLTGGTPSRGRRASRFAAPRPVRPRASAVLAAFAVASVLLAILASASPGVPPAGGARSAHPDPGPRGPRAPVQGAPSFSTSTTGAVPVDASRFALGACETFAPSRRSNHHTVFLDAGHGGVDPGGKGVTASGKVIYEAGENLTIELETMNLLRSEGYRVVVSRTANVNVMKPGPADLTGGVLSATGARDDIAARDACADQARATILVGIYFDAGTSPANAGSLTAYDPARPFASRSRALATFLQRDVLARMNERGWQIPDDGVPPDTTLGGLPLTTAAAAYRHLLLLGPDDPGWFSTASRMPGALIEPLFISDPFEGSIADSAAGHDAIAEGLAEGIEQYFGSPGR